MEKILGIDTGTNSLGWAILECNEKNEYRLLERGTNTFQEGVKIEKGIESSKAAERTAHRSLRKHYWRRKVRKIRLLAILVENHFCPPLDRQELRQWRLKKLYPTDEHFMAWQRTEDKEDVNPYRFRHICLTQKLDFSNISQRYILGRALYHLNQRRGFLSNRKEGTKESDGTVMQGIDTLTAEMEQAGCRYLGEYFYTLYRQGRKIRSHYTARNAHYLAEFKAICEKQSLDAALAAKLERAIFFQRPLKSQKQSVGKCTFEPKKSRCPASHPMFEEFRMYSFLNHIKIQTPADEELRPLTVEEIQQISPLFYRKSKPTFPFEEIAKRLAGRGKYAHYMDKVEKPYKFNYYMDTPVSGCPVNAQLADIFGEDWLSAVCEVYTLAAGKNRTEICNDIWHVLFSFSDENKLRQFAADRLQLADEDAVRFSRISLPQDYASLSLKAIRKILPYMRDYGLIYSEAVFLANLCEVLPAHVWGVPQLREAAISNVIGVMHEEHFLHDGLTTEQRVKNFLLERYGVDYEHSARLYHPSMLEVYPRQLPNEDGVYQLGSPRIASVKNPMAMHSLFRLRKVVNALLKSGKIDEETTIRIEFSRDLNDANRRRAIQTYQRGNEKLNETYRAKMKEVFDEMHISREPSDTDITKYQLWEEQNHKCLYTGDEIGLADFLGSNPKYDIEHTIPRSAGGDSTKMNLTLCQNRFNREVKKAMLPAQLSNHEEILARIEPWKEEWEKLDSQIRKLKKAPAATKEAKDRNIQRRHELMLRRDYWRGKYRRFTMTEVPEGFSRRQGVDISVISRYARLYLKSVFRHVHIVKGIATSDFRKIWGIQQEYVKKERVNHTHHCIDAVTIGCIGPYEYAQLAQYYHRLEEHEKYGLEKPQFPKPWPTFVEDMNALQDSLVIAHHTPDNMLKQARHRIQTPQGRVLAKGDVARGSLHLDTYYGAIEREGEIRSVIRKNLESVTDINQIVDDAVRQKVQDAINLHGTLAKAIEAGIWMNEEKRIPIKKVRCYVKNQQTLNIRTHRDVSKHEYKRTYHVWNDGNYMLAIYEGEDSKGKKKREFEEVKMIDAADYYKTSNKANTLSMDIVPVRSKNDYPLQYKLKIGKMVLLYDECADEVWELTPEELQRRLYKITGMSLSDGRMVLVHHQEARPSKDVPQKDGAYTAGEAFRPKIRISMNQFKALVDGVDFELNELGEIRRLI